MFIFIVVEILLNVSNTSKNKIVTKFNSCQNANSKSSIDIQHIKWIKPEILLLTNFDYLILIYLTTSLVDPARLG